MWWLEGLYIKSLNSMAQQDEDFIIFQEMRKEDSPFQKQSVERQPIAGHYNSLYDELLEKCNPANFYEPYDSKRVELANEIYSKVLQNPHDEVTLKKLRLRAINELDIKFSTLALFDKLIEICHPRNFGPGHYYDPEKLAKANRIYSEILENADDVVVLEQCEENAQDIIQVIAERREKELKEEEKRKKAEEKKNAEKQEKLNRKKELEDSKDNFKMSILSSFLMLVLLCVIANLVFHLIQYESIWVGDYLIKTTTLFIIGCLIVFSVVVFLLVKYFIVPLYRRYKDLQKNYNSNCV